MGQVIKDESIAYKVGKTAGDGLRSIADVSAEFASRSIEGLHTFVHGEQQARAKEEMGNIEYPTQVKPSITSTTPEKVLEGFSAAFDKFKTPVPGGTAIQALNKFLRMEGKVNDGPNTIGKNIKTEVMSRLQDDAKLSPQEAILAVAAAGNKTAPNSKPNSALVTQAQDILHQNGIADRDGTLSKGLARASINIAIEQQQLVARIQDSDVTYVEAATPAKIVKGLNRQP